MGNLEKSRHGWEGLSNGGEIYGNQSKSTYEQQKKNIKSEMFNDMIKKGMDRVMAYQVAYGISNEAAKELASRDNYNNLISCGLTHEMAMKIAYGSNDDNQKTR